MAQEEQRFGRALGNVIAWMGFALMVGSLVRWQMIPAPTATTSKHDSRTPAPFTLVVLDPGHGGQDSAAMCGGILETDLTLDIVQRVDRLLQAQGLATLMTQAGDR